MPDCGEVILLTSTMPVLTAEEVFAVNDKIRWVGLTTASGGVLVNHMRPGVSTYTTTQVDEEFVTLSPLTVLGVAEKYSKYLNGVEDVVVHYGLVIHVFARLGSQILDVSIEKDNDALSQFLNWLKKKKTELQQQDQSR